MRYEPKVPTEKKRKTSRISKKINKHYQTVFHKSEFHAPTKALKKI